MYRLMRRGVYGLSMVPVLAVAAEQNLLGADGWPALAMQLGVGGVVAAVGLKIALVLYQAKEDATREHHAALMELTKQHLEELIHTRAAVQELCKVMDRHEQAYEANWRELRRELTALAAQRELDR